VGDFDCFQGRDGYSPFVQKAQFSMNWKRVGLSVAKACETALTALEGRTACFGLLIIFLVGVIPPVLGDDYCSGCMEKAMTNYAEGVMAGIQKNWGTYQQVLELVRKYEKSGTEQQKAQAREILAQAREKWMPYASMAHAFASPEFAAQLDGYKEYLSGQLQQEKERLQKETELYAKLAKTTLEAQRQGVLNDLAGVEKESNAAKAEFKDDCWMGGISAATAIIEFRKAQALRGLSPPKNVQPINGWDKMVEVFVGATKKKSDLAARIEAKAALESAAVRNVAETRKAYEKEGAAKQMAAAVQAVADTGLTVIKAVLAVKPELAATVRPAVSGAAALAGTLQMVAPVLDCGLLYFSFQRLNQDNQRIEAVDALEKPWQSRIKTLGDEVNSTERRLKMVETETALQRQVAKINKEIEAASKE
jgi:hypothetical protein